jgi:hypothetical protein
MTDMPRKFNYRDLEDYAQHNDGTPHRPDLKTIAVSPEHLYMSPDPEWVVMDVWCLDCGLSGSFNLKITAPDEVQWE